MIAMVATLWADPAFRETHKAAVNAAMAAASYRDNQSKAQKAVASEIKTHRARRLLEPEIRARALAASTATRRAGEYGRQKSIQMTDWWAIDENRERTREAMTSAQARPETRERKREASLAAYPAKREALIRGVKASWADPIKRKVRIAKLSATAQARVKRLTSSTQ
jgi:hypothetical protein